MFIVQPTMNIDLSYKFAVIKHFSIYLPSIITFSAALCWTGFLIGSRARLMSVVADFKVAS